MFLNSKRGQLSIEILIIALGLLLSGTILASHMTKNTGSHSEISGLKKNIFAGPMMSYIATSAVNGSFESLENEDDEPVDTITNITGDLNINPGHGLGYGIYEFYAEYFTDVYYIDKLHGNPYVTKGSGDIAYLPYAGSATEIKLKAKNGTSLSINGEEIPNNYKLYTITSKNSGESFSYSIDGHSTGTLYLSIDESDYNKIQIRIEHNGHGPHPDLVYPEEE
ncbi:hypothetical protein MmarC5_1005 [Methanococcus maripaludis C5]|uniref:Class III signal peptide n=1 Tax=Methanococcus maripaludis (strain C5 / ATCC BAA-1333) TaxID=402880 RepID=A4FYM7_METM5|nr:hypothetical protein [Methanococcus maripaludis]ABO35311.1 hypothetical protein MmarC5_1005 [Methanococcus maripaludis C5]